MMFLVLAMLPSCCHTGSREQSSTEGSPTPRMHPVYEKALKKHSERDFYYRDKADPEDTDE